MGEPQVKEKAWGAGPSGTGPTSAVPPSGRAGRPASSWARRLGAQLCVWHPSTMGPGARSLKGVSGPGPTRCVQAECFDQLVRHCVACRLLRTPEPRAASRPVPSASSRGEQPGAWDGAAATGVGGPRGPAAHAAPARAALRDPHVAGPGAAPGPGPGGPGELEVAAAQDPGGSRKEPGGTPGKRLHPLLGNP
ncbi:PREDICTED: tumor necrosis factor receptor superfamily member 13C isoform X3 [Chinchilla lanigera]|uniref:tumor necrosis factor receptor superfamily member 13C isoform X3 n=1 Tax=Chinchilla lanigera TaxID=34839 RepID=UPI0006978F31|nr:PREDICTED: tumor necrosis factor receptor superfamily member 13C isoform X3 [Chinchilla lanigera]